MAGALDPSVAGLAYLDERLWLMGYEDCSVGLDCRICDRGGLPIAYYAPYSGSPYGEGADVVNVTTIAALLDAGVRHLADRHAA